MKKQLVFIDDSGDPGFKGAASSHFVVACAIFMDDLVAEEVALAMRKYRRLIGWDDERKIIDVRYVESKENMLIQLADLVAGSIFRSTQIKKSDHADYMKIIRKRIDRIHKYEE